MTECRAAEASTQGAARGAGGQVQKGVSSCLGWEESGPQRFRARGGSKAGKVESEHRKRDLARRRPRRGARRGESLVPRDHGERCPEARKRRTWARPVLTLKVPDEPPTALPPAPAPVARRAMSGAAGVDEPDSETMRGCSEVIAKKREIEREQERGVWVVKCGWVLRSSRGRGRQKPDRSHRPGWVG